jgi:hypothetical protein
LFLEKITASVTGQLRPVGCETKILWPPRKMQATYFFGFDLRGHSRVKNKKESIDGLGEALVSVPYITPRSFL